MSSRIQSSKQGRELRNSRGRLPSVRTGAYDLFQARMDTRKERMVIGTTDSGPKYRERPSVAEAVESVIHTSSASSASATSEINSEIMKMNQELKYQADQHRAEIEHLKTLIEHIRHSTPSAPLTPVAAVAEPATPNTTMTKDKELKGYHEEHLSKQALFQQEIGYTIQEIAHKLQMLENNIHHIEEMRDKDPGDPTIIHHDSVYITKEDIGDIVTKIVEPVRLGLEQIEEDILKEDDILDIIAGAIDPLQKNNEIMKDALMARMDSIQKIVDTIVKTSTPSVPSTTSSLKKEDVIETVRSMLTPIVKDIQQNAKDTSSTKSLIDEKIGILDKQLKASFELSLRNVQREITAGVDKSITAIDSRINKLSDTVKSIPAPTVSKTDIQSIQDNLKSLKEELKADIQTSRQSARNEGAEREREISKEQKRILDKILDLEKKISGKEMLKKPSSRDLVSVTEEVNSTATTAAVAAIATPSRTILDTNEHSVLKNEVVYMTDDNTKKRLAEIEEKLDAIQKKPSSGSGRSVTPIQRRSQSREREIDGHRLRDVPVFSAELRETMVVKGDAGPMPLINDALWNVIADTAAGFDYGGGYYECPVTGAYTVNLICKTLSTSVTLKITLVHIDSAGHILKAYSLDQSNMINEHSMSLRLPHTEKGDRLKFLVESRFNIALKGHEEIEVRGQKYPIVSTLVQIAYIPPVGFCET